MMVYLDQQTRSQTNAVVEFSVTVVLTIEALQIRIKSLQESLQRFEVKKAESKTSKQVVGRLAKNKSEVSCHRLDGDIMSCLMCGLCVF